MILDQMIYDPFHLVLPTQISSEYRQAITSKLESKDKDLWNILERILSGSSIVRHRNDD